MKLVRMKPGHGDVLLAEGDPAVAEDEERLVEEFRRQLELGMWAAVPTSDGPRREAAMVRDFSEVPRDAERVVFFPPAAGG
jgi:hypothetical protein